MLAVVNHLSFVSAKKVPRCRACPKKRERFFFILVNSGNPFESPFFKRLEPPRSRGVNPSQKRPQTQSLSEETGAFFVKNGEPLRVSLSKRLGPRYSCAEMQMMWFDENRAQA